MRDLYTNLVTALAPTDHKSNCSTPKENGAAGRAANASASQFSLRAMKTVLTLAAEVRRADPHLSEEAAVLQVCSCRVVSLKLQVQRNLSG